MKNTYGRLPISVLVIDRNDSAIPDFHQKALHPVALPSGLVMSNGLVKVAMYEHMATLFGGLPNAHHLALYDLWSQGGWGMIITGNVQVSRDHLTLGKDMVVPETITSDTLHSYKTLAHAMRPVSERNLAKNGDDSMPRTLIIMQVSHTGRQSPILLGGRSLHPPLAPSACGLGRNASNWFARLMYRILFPTPRSMSMQDIDNVVNRFVLSANLAHDAGFDGIELHASHGCKFSPGSFCGQEEM
jgi:2,4-dienoyl-CoA reductase-like NADH-dependent reductase (Old Yellow Enzyme family)